MKKMTVMLLVFLLCGAVVVSAETVRPGLEIGSRVFAYYLYDFSFYPDSDVRHNRNGRNYFELGRAELRLTGWASRLFYGEVMAEADRVRAFTVEVAEGESKRVEPDNYGNYELILKHAFLQANIDRRFNIRAGAIPEPWIVAEEQFWPYRFVEEPLSIRSGSAWDEADIGVAFLGEFKTYKGGYEIGIINGEGYKKPEDDPNKAGYLALKYRTAAGFSADLAARFEVVDNPEGNLLHAVATPSLAFGYRWNDRLICGVEGIMESYIRDQDLSNSLAFYGSLFGSVRVAGLTWLILRGDIYDYNLDEDAKMNSRRASRVGGGTMTSDEDREYAAMAGAVWEIDRMLRVGIMYRLRAWQETYPENQKDAGDTIRPEHIAKAAVEFGF